MNRPTLYEMLEDKGGTLLETLVYGSLLGSVVASIVYMALQPVIA